MVHVTVREVTVQTIIRQMKHENYNLSIAVLGQTILSETSDV